MELLEVCWFGVWSVSGSGGGWSLLSLFLSRMSVSVWVSSDSSSSSSISSSSDSLSLLFRVAVDLGVVGVGGMRVTACIGVLFFVCLMFSCSCSTPFLFSGGDLDLECSVVCGVWFCVLDGLLFSDCVGGMYTSG